MQTKSCGVDYIPSINPNRMRVGEYKCPHCGSRLKRSGKSQYTFHCTCPRWNKNMRVSIG